MSKVVKLKDYDKLRQLEESLWIEDTRFNQEYMNSILSPDFFEFGRSGKVYSRDEIISVPRQEIKIKLPLEEFNIHQITSDVALITYVSEVQYKDLEVGNRSSLWCKTSDGWKLQFHQGTIVNIDAGI